MTKSIALIPAALAIALSLSACGGKSDTGGNVAIANDVVLNDEGEASGNLTADNVVLPEEGTFDNAVTLNGTTPNDAAPATNGL